MIIQVYSTPKCPWCDRAKALLRSKGLAFEEIELNVGQILLEGKSYLEATEFKMRFPGINAVPLIVMNGQRIGGFNELTKLFEDQRNRELLLG